MPTPPVILLCAAGVGLAALLYYYFTAKDQRETTGYQYCARPRRPRGRENRDDLEQCSICQEVIINNVSMKTLICGHTFHNRCINKWFEAVPSTMNCPNCRMNAL